ncbi:PAS domain-containing sensor histidine kinase [Mucilaginibacter sp. HMF5004]|uniref:ATP-binding protein n=1 Tax=Mucilaginibacter rivuli TaxID=2857527 RepID=UPI001C5FBB54|nr:ATP-binding protein [Mucilaginibacter rivuli]MBW4891805.1 PAS domain-containing sensor histidine kinase [Mucilaginibacter rivuli]
MILYNYRNKERTVFLFVATAAFVIFLGLLAILGWYLKEERLQSILPNYVAMKFNTALCFILSGISFILLIKYQSKVVKRIFYLFIFIVGAIALLTLAEYVFHWSAGIDQLFITDSNSYDIRVPYPGRMAISTAICFIIWAFSFWAIDSENIIRKAVAQYLLHLVALISFIAIMAYLLKVPFSADFSFFSAMAINTSVAFLTLSIVASTVNPHLGLTRLFTGTGIGNVVARKFYPRLMGMVFLVGYVGIVLHHKGVIIFEFSIVIFAVLFLLISLFLIRDTLIEMNELDKKRSDAEYQMQLLNRELEDKVLERTAQLQLSSDRFQKIFNTNPTGITLSKLATGEYVDANPAILDILGYKRDELIGHLSSELEIISVDYRQQMVGLLTRQGFIKNEDVLLNGKNGIPKHCILSAEIIENDGEKYMMSFVYDITDRKLAENKLKETKKELEILTDKLTGQNRQLLNFAHIISHNLRSPVSNLNLLVHLYKESVDDADRQELWGNFETVTQHLNVTLDELLETLKIQEDTAKERENLDFEKTFRGIREILVGQIIESKAVIKADFSKATHVMYPKIYLESIMLNLISNSIKYRSPHRIPEITIVTGNNNGEISLSIQDNGLGIDLNRHAKNLFGMRKTFHRHAEAKGLGLFITKTQIEAMGGEISAESEVDKGTKFTVIFNKITG